MLWSEFMSAQEYFCSSIPEAHVNYNDNLIFDHV